MNQIYIGTFPPETFFKKKLAFETFGRKAYILKAH